jgi:hypothetical protein
MKTGYDPLIEDEKDDIFSGLFDEDYLEEKEDGLFRVGQSYEKKPCKTFYCKKCGSNKFYVGTGNYFTAIKCVNCNYEICVHDG